MELECRASEYPAILCEIKDCLKRYHLPYSGMIDVDTIDCHVFGLQLNSSGLTFNFNRGGYEIVPLEAFLVFNTATKEWDVDITPGKIKAIPALDRPVIQQWLKIGSITDKLISNLRVADTTKIIIDSNPEMDVVTVFNAVNLETDSPEIL